MEGTGGPASNHRVTFKAEEITDPVSRYSSVCANEQLNRCSPTALCFLNHPILVNFRSLMWKNVSSIQLSGVSERKITEGKNNFRKPVFLLQLAPKV